MTHLQNDVVSGQVELAKITGAAIVCGPGVARGYERREAADAEVLQLGRLKIKVLHTPGHTLESCCLLLLGEDGQPHCLFTGDTLFVGGMPIPDLAQAGAAAAQYELAGMLYDSLRHKLLPLPDEVLVYPGHGAGSLCGKNIGPEKFSTLGAQKQSNPALLIQDRDDFISTATSAMPPLLPYFTDVAALNRHGCADLETVMQTAATPLAPAALRAALDQGVWLLDTRSAQEFGQGFIPGAINIGLDGLLEAWVGTLIEDNEQPFIVVAPPGREQEALLRLTRIGYDAALGFLEGGMASWVNAGHAVDVIDSVSAQQLAQSYRDAEAAVLDCRMPFEFNAGHVASAVSYPLNFINQCLDDIDRQTTYYIHCKSGYRSMAAASILRKHGYRNVIDIHDGFDGLLATDIPISG
jgi:rhodanese-related sulfurtransferase/glyoxylase-like metal-dependent hydrolase (beta-lactamase superfamily II)